MVDKISTNKHIKIIF